MNKELGVESITSKLPLRGWPFVTLNKVKSERSDIPNSLAKRSEAKPTIFFILAMPKRGFA